MNTQAKRRVLAAATALTVYAAGACADTPAEPQHTAYSDQPKQQRVAAPEIPADWTAPPSRTPRPARAARTQRAPRSDVASTPRVEGDVWHALAMCESGMRQHALSANGLYYSYYQWSLATWRSVGGAGDPRTVDYETQKRLAQRLQARSGWGQWPRCARKLGLT